MNYLRLAEFKVMYEKKLSSLRGFREMLSQTFDPEKYDEYKMKNSYYYDCEQVYKHKLSLLNTALKDEWPSDEEEFRKIFNGIKLPNCPF